MKDDLIDALLITSCTAIVVLAFLSLLRVNCAQARPEPPEPKPASKTTEAIPLRAAPAAGKAVRERPRPEPAPSYDPAIPLPEELQCILRNACQANGVDYALALGVIEEESRFDVDAENPTTHAYGLMQLNPKYFTSGLPPGENILAGVEYLGQCLAGAATVEAGLEIYHAGHDTGMRDYAGRVLEYAEHWRLLL